MRAELRMSLWITELSAVVILFELGDSDVDQFSHCAIFVAESLYL